jgi:ectoine hydroxylase-related dioxygenase (phytanoyl-CoA dioxygenase family)
MDPTKGELDYGAAIPLTGRAGSISIHHVRAAHASAPNTSNRERRFFLMQFRAADAWPLLGFPGGVEAYDRLMVAGQPSLAPRLADVPVRLPLPPADLQGSIYENQKALKNKFFATPAV